MGSVVLVHGLSCSSSLPFSTTYHFLIVGLIVVKVFSLSLYLLCAEHCTHLILFPLIIIVTGGLLFPIIFIICEESADVLSGTSQGQCSRWQSQDSNPSLILELEL